MGACRLLHFAVLILAVVAVITIEVAAAASVVIGGAKCADCSRKNMDAEAAFKGLQVAINCKNGSSDEYESKAVGELDGTGAFSVPIAADLSGTDCLAQLQSATNSPCPGQEPSKIVPLSEGTFVVVAGKTHFPSKECASTTICFPCHKRHIFGQYRKKPGFMHKKPMPEYQPPSPDYGTPASGCPPPSPGYGQPAPECPPTDPGYGQPTPECPPPSPSYGTPAPDCPPTYGQPTPVRGGQPTPECPPPTPEYGTPGPACPPPTPEYGTPTPACPPPTPEYGTPTPACPPPTPQYGTPTPECPPATPEYSTPSPTPIYRPPGNH